MNKKDIVRLTDGEQSMGPRKSPTSWTLATLT